MDKIRLHVDIEKRLGIFHLRVELEVGTEILVLFGPSGAGKTQTLHTIAGLTTPDAGEITLDDQIFFRRHRASPAIHLSARKRKVGFVFQQYALFPHMTALENVAYALWRQLGAHQKAVALLERMHLTHVAQHYPHEMSGGQQQRVALARALAMEPQVLLLDEPFSALDAAMRERLQQDLRTLQAELSLVVICVTHNLDDAFAVGHRLAVMREGQVTQVGPIESVFRRPASDKVLEILGIRNVFHARVIKVGPTGLHLDWDGLILEAPLQPIVIGELVTAYIRPEDIKVLYPDRPLTNAVGYNQVVGKVMSKQLQSSSQTLRVSLANNHEVEIRFPTYTYTPLPLIPGEDVRLSLRKEGIIILREPSLTKL
jgi:molybdate transport system ATP-binding protein